MNKKELWAKFNQEWKQNNQTMYAVWLIFYVGSYVPLLISVLSFLGEVNDESVGRALICLVIFFIMEIVAMVPSLQRKKAWKEYRQKHENE